MTLLNVDNDGSSLANFNPISYPENSEIEDRILPQDYNRWKKTTTTSNFGLDNSNTVHNPSEYNQAYEISHNKPNYIDNGNNNNNSDNISQKIRCPFWSTGFYVFTRRKLRGVDFRKLRKTVGF